MACIKCNVTIRVEVDKVVRCDGCNRPVHLACSELTAAELKCFDLRSSAKRRVKYLCDECEQGLHQIPKIFQLINELRDEIRELKRAGAVDVSVTQLPAPVPSSEQVIAEVF